MFGAGAREVSAFMGILYIIDEFVPGYSWEGGLGAVSEAVAGSLGERVRTGATVVSSKQGPEGVTVEYLREGKLHRVKADAAVFATHHFITLRIAKDLTPAKAEAFRSMRYSSYLIVPLAFREKVWDRSFSLWNADTFLTDITFAGPQALEGGGEASGPGQVGTAYIPLGVEEGRTYLLNTTDEEIVARVKADLDKLLPGAAAKVREARVIRWGHAMPVMGPGFFKTLQPILEKPEGRYVFAGEDVQAPALEGAVISAHRAAGEARRILAKVK